MTRFVARLVSCASLSLACAVDADERDGTELRIDMRPVDAIAYHGVFEPDAGGTLRATHAIAFALHDDYPDALEVTIGDQYATCGALAGTFTIDAIASQDADLGITTTGTSSFRIAPVREGDFEAVVSGRFVAADGAASCVGDDASFEVKVAVPVRRPVGVRVVPPFSCADSSRVRVETDAQIDEGLRVELVDDAGESFRPHNAASTHPATLTLTTGADTQMELHTPGEGLAALVVSGAEDAITISAFDAAHDVIEHVAPQSIDVVGVGFGLLGFGGGSTLLVDGGVYGELGWSRTSASIGVTSSGLEVDGEQICTLPRAEAFSITSETPEVCVAHAELGHGDGLIGEGLFDPAIAISAEVVASGVCVLEVEAEGYGFVEAVEVEILNAEGLFRAGVGR